MAARVTSGCPQTRWNDRLVYPGQRLWKRGHDEWLRLIRFERAAEQAIFEDYRLSIIQVDERIKTLDSRWRSSHAKSPTASPPGGCGASTASTRSPQ